MKKITVLLIALVLVCTSAFASFSVTVGGGYGTKVPVYENFEASFGPTVLFGADISTKNGISFYDDIELGIIIFNGNNAHPISAGFYDLTEKLGFGYTFRTDAWDLMVGVGGRFQMLFGEGFKVLEYRPGAELRVKATFACSERFGLSVQFDPAFDFASIAETAVINGNEISGNALVGFTFKF